MSVGSSATTRQRSKVGTLSLKKKREWIPYCFKVTSSTYFHYFDQTDTNKAKGQILLHQVARVEILNTASGPGYPFAVHLGDKNSSWILSAASEADRASWVETIKPGTLAQQRNTPSFAKVEPESYDTIATPPSTQPTSTPRFPFTRLFSKTDDSGVPVTTHTKSSSQLSSPVASMQPRRSLGTASPTIGALRPQVSVGEVTGAEPPPQASTPPDDVQLYAEPYMEPSLFAAFVDDCSELEEDAFRTQGAECEPLLPSHTHLEVEQIPRKVQTPLPTKTTEHHNLSSEKRQISVSCPDSLCCDDMPWDLGFMGQADNTQKAQMPLPGNTQKAQMPLPDNTQKAQMPLPDNTQKAQMPLPDNTQKAQMPLPGNTQKAQMPLPGNTQKAQMPLPDNTQKAQMPLPDNTQKAQMPLPGNTQKAQMPLPDNTQKAQMPLPDNTQKAQMPLPGNTQKAQMPLPDNTQKAQMPLPDNTQKAQMPLPGNTQKALMPLPDNTQKAQMPLPGNTQKAQSSTRQHPEGTDASTRQHPEGTDALPDNTQKARCLYQATPRRHRCFYQTTPRRHRCLYQATPRRHRCFYQTTPRRHRCLYQATPRRHRCLYQTTLRRHRCLYQATPRRHRCLYQTTPRRHRCLYQTTPRRHRCL
ncbi:hypothetical protein EMCRGX_G034644 [Ephydatia muelleri]